MQFVQMSDLHLRLDVPDLYGLKGELRLRQALEHVARYRVETKFIVVTGDLADCGDAASYEKVREVLASSGFPVFVVPGNHDNPELMEAIFERCSVGELKPGVFFADRLELANAQCLFLNTCRSGTGAGWLDDHSIDLLREALKSSDSRPLLAFLHHPPFVSGLRDMDAIRLLNADAVLAAAESSSRRISAIFCGHLHRPMTAVWHGIPCFCAASVVHEIDARCPAKPTMGTLEAPEYLSFSLSEDGIVCDRIDFTWDAAPIGIPFMPLKNVAAS